jgi:hypothetical protein
MKCQSFSFLALLGLAAARNGDLVDPVKGSPVTKVVNLLSDLQKKIQNDGKAESQIYNKYACWCETTTARKAAAITQAENDLRSLGQQILKLKGKTATLTAEIKELDEKLATNKEEQEEATSIRQKRNGKYQAMAAETKQAIAAMETAIEVLREGSSLLQTDSAVRATSAVQSFLDKIPSEAPLDIEHMSLLSNFAANGAETNFAPQSATIQGILQDMYTTFASNLEEATMTEAKQNKNYEKLTATMQMEAIDMNTIKARSADEKAEAESDLADATATYDTTTDQMKSDIKFFDETRDACDNKHKEWTLREKMREQELAGVEKAMEFLSSDEARDLFAKSIQPGVGFLQIKEDDSQAATFKAYGMLKAMATKSKSLRLASLAVRVRTTKAGHFDKVIKAIDTMIGTLNDEGAADRAKRNQCKEEYQNVAQTVGDLDWKLKNNEATIDKIDETISLRSKEKQETIDQINDTNDFIKKISDDRKAANEEFIENKKLDKAAVELLNKAKDALSAFYKKQGIKMIQADPAFAVSEDQAPDASFSGKGSRKGQSKNIVELMDYIIEDLEDEIKNAVKDEAKEQAEFEEQLKTANTLVDDLTSKQKNLEDQIAKKKGDKTDEQKDMGENTKDRDSELDYKAKITPDCDWILKNFEGRATARDAEMSGLVSAKEFLAGKTSLLQVETPVKSNVENKLASINFLGLQ